MKHTPTPWNYNPGRPTEQTYVIGACKLLGLTYRREDAEHIVKCVNAYDRHVEILDELTSVDRKLRAERKEALEYIAVLEAENKGLQSIAVELAKEVLSSYERYTTIMLAKKSAHVEKLTTILSEEPRPWSTDEEGDGCAYDTLEEKWAEQGEDY